MDSYAIDYRYSDDGYNLLTRKTTPDGLIITYAYLPHTNLLTKELHHYDGRIQERFFYTYDDNGELQKSIEDNGSDEEENDLTDVTFRKVKTIEAVQDSTPAFGKPRKQTESYLLGEALIPLKTTEFFYDKHGNEIQQKISNSGGTFCYSTTKTYNEKQQLIQEADPLGQVKEYKYDENRNKTEEIHIG